MGLKDWFRRRRPTGAELREEVESHVAMRAERDGSDQAAARARLGGVLRTEEQMRRVWQGSFWDTLLPEAVFLLRLWRRTPGVSGAALATLALGLGAGTALFSICDRILFRDPPYTAAGQLVSVGLMAPLDANEFLLGPDYAQLWRQTPAPFESVTTVTAGTAACDLTELQPQRLTCAHVEWNLLGVLGLQPAAGRDFGLEDDRIGAAPVALISHGLWLGRFGRDPRVIGRMLSLDGAPVEVIGVLPPGFELPTLAAADVLRPQLLPPPGAPVGMRFLRGFARLQPGVTVEGARAALGPLFKAMLRNVPAAFRKEVTLRVRPLRDRQFGESRRAAWLLLGAAAALLLIACVNVANLLLARTAARQQELAIRAALGASRGRLARLALLESTLLSLLGGAAGLGIAGALVRLLIAATPDGIPKLDQASLDSRAWLAALALVFTAAPLTAVWTAFSLPRLDALHGARSAGPIRPWARFAFVVLQIGLTFALLGGAALLLRSLWKLQHVPLGFESQGVLAVGITLSPSKYPQPAQQIAFFEQLLERAAAMPGVLSAAISDSLPPGGGMRSMIFAHIEVAGQPRAREGTGGMVGWRLVTPGYFEVLGLRIVRGRGFLPADRGGESTLILSEALERRLFPNGNAVGQRIRAGGEGQPWRLVAGIASDARNAGLAARPEPEYYVLRSTGERDATRRSLLLLRTQGPALTAGMLRQTFTALDPQLPVEIETLDGRVAQLAARPRFLSMLLLCFGALALCLAVAGVAGVAGYLVNERTRELGVRIALGATPADIRRTVLRETARWLVGGAIAGVLLAAAAGSALRALLFEVPLDDPWSWAAALLVLAAGVILSTLPPAYRAARIDPMQALRAG